MKTSRIVVHALALVISMTASAVANAAQRTFVASYGNDQDTCTIAAPCRGFTRALTETDAGGEIIVLDSAGYGTLTISRSVAIIAPPGVYAGISVPSGNGITINGGNIDVTLRGVTINGQGGVDGIHVTLAGSVHIENCTIAKMTGDGIEVADDVAILIKDSLIRDNGRRGVYVNASADNSTLRADRSWIERNGDQGIYVQSTSKVTVRDTTLADNGMHGMEVEAVGKTIVVDVVKALVRGNGAAGISIQSYNDGVAHASISDSVVSDNHGSGIDAFSAHSETRVAADRNMLVGNLYSGMSSTNQWTTVLANANVSMRNDIGLGRNGGGDMRSLGNNLVEENNLDTQWAAPTIVSGK